MRSFAHERWPVVLCLAVLLGLAGCSSDETSQPLTDEAVQADVETGSIAAALAAPSAEASESLILGLLGTLGAQAVPAPAGSGVQPAVSPPSCPAPDFDLGNGITGTCEVSEENVVTLTFSGTTMVNGDSVSLEGSLVATPLDDGQGGTAGFTVEFNATATGPRGTATWSATGTVQLTETGQPAGHSLSMTHTVAPVGGAPAVVTTTVTPDTFILLTAGQGGFLELELDRSTMSGVISLNGIEVALVEVTEGCVRVDYVNPDLTDETVCPEA